MLVGAGGRWPRPTLAGRRRGLTRDQDIKKECMSCQDDLHVRAEKGVLIRHSRRRHGRVCMREVPSGVQQGIRAYLTNTLKCK